MAKLDDHPDRQAAIGGAASRNPLNLPTRRRAMQKSYRIGDLARLVDLPIETIRFYERERLLPEPPRTTGNYRLYSDDQRERLFFIRHCRSLDMTLAEIRQLLHKKDSPDQSCADVNALLDAHIDHVTTRIAELRRLEDELVSLRRQCRAVKTGRECEILQHLATDAPAQIPEVRGHVDLTHRRRLT